MDVSGSPSSSFEVELRDYVRYVIDEAWPLQREDVVPAEAPKGSPRSSRT